MFTVTIVKITTPSYKLKLTFKLSTQFKLNAHYLT